MAKNFAKYKSRRPRLNVSWPFVLAALLFSVLIFCAAFGFYLNQSKSAFFGKPVATIKLWLSKKNTESRKEISEPVESPVQFDFYEELPKVDIDSRHAADSVKQEVVPLADSGSKERIIPSSEKVVAKPPSYWVEASHYENASSASQARISLLLSGVEVDLVKVNSSKGVVFSLRQGPYASLAEAKKAAERLKKKGLEPTLLPLQGEETPPISTVE